MQKITREDIKIIGCNSNLSSKDIHKILQQNIYSDKVAWIKFLKLFIISLGVGFLTSGILFFFAYNWDELHKFTKLILIEGVIVGSSLLLLLPKLNRSSKQILLTGLSVLVGVLFAVFGQIYQTGANAYDLFFSWTLAITLWTLVANFAPLWLLYIVLVNTSFILYSQQVANHWPDHYIITGLLTINSLALIFAILSKKYLQSVHIPKWFTHTLALVSVYIGTMGSISCIWGMSTPIYTVPLLTMLLYVASIFYGFLSKQRFYLAIVAFSVIVIFTSLIIRKSFDINMLFIASLFTIGSITATVFALINIKKRWEK